MHRCWNVRRSVVSFHLRYVETGRRHTSPVFGGVREGSLGARAVFLVIGTTRTKVTSQDRGVLAAVLFVVLADVHQY